MKIAGISDERAKRSFSRLSETAESFLENFAKRGPSKGEANTRLAANSLDPSEESVRGIPRIDFPRAAASIMDNQRMKSLIHAASATTHNKWRLHPLFLLSAIIEPVIYPVCRWNLRCRNARARATITRPCMSVSIMETLLVTSATDTVNRVLSSHGTRDNKKKHWRNAGV